MPAGFNTKKYICIKIIIIIQKKVLKKRKDKKNLEESEESDDEASDQEDEQTINKYRSLLLGIDKVIEYTFFIPFH